MTFRCEVCEQKHDGKPSLLEDRGDCVVVCGNCWAKRLGYGMRAWGEQKRKYRRKNVLVDNRRNPTVAYGL